MDRIPVHRPQLPKKDLIIPYLEQIDEARWYSNFGPLLSKFEYRLANHFGVSPEMVGTASNGTLMLISILKAFAIPENSLCIMPSWTFVATASAACYAGLIPYFLDVDYESQALEPEELEEQLAFIKQPIGAIITIAPFGAPIDRQKWDAFTKRTGIPVIIDAAAAFDTVCTMPMMSVGLTPMMISLHATKVLGIGEGGLMLSTDTDLVRKVRTITSFGFNANRESLTLGFNAKLSEYTAAVGLAALDQWENTRRQWECVRNYYMECLEKINVTYWLSSEWVGSTCNVILSGNAQNIAFKLSEVGIDTRKWWNSGCHQEQAYSQFPKGSLDNTNWLGESTLGLPFYVDLELKAIERITSELKIVLESHDKLIAIG